MSQPDYHDNPFAPKPLSGMEDFTVRCALRLEQGIFAILDTKEEFSSRSFFFSPANRPDKFYLMYSFSCDGGYPLAYGFNTDSSPSCMCLYFFDDSSSKRSYGMYSDQWDSPPFHKRNDDDVLTFQHFEQGERNLLEQKMLSGQVSFYDLPSDDRISHVFIPPLTTGLDGKIILTHSRFYQGKGAYFLPSDTSKPAEWISFFNKDTGEKLSYTRLTHSYPLTHGETFDVQIGRGEKQSIDFTGTSCLDSWDEDDVALTQKIIESGRIPTVPIEPTRLVTPLTAEILFPKPQQPAIPALPKPPEPS